MYLVLALIVVAALVALVVGGSYWRYRRSRQLLARWARQSRVELLRAERRLVSRGPFFWRSSDSQIVFRVTVRDRDGRVRHGFVRIGGWFLGVLSDQTAAEWED
jgi:hypothetical protein